MNKRIFNYFLSAIVGSAALSATSCADEDLVNNQHGNNDVVRFTINDVQEQTIALGKAITRGAITPEVKNSNLYGQKLAAQSNRNIDVCLIETTIEGVNPVKTNARTRANIENSIGGDFSSTGIRGIEQTSIQTTPEWFYAAKTKSNGELYSSILWNYEIPWARFFAVYPSKDNYSKLTIGNTSASGSPSVDFEVEPNVKDQKDFMTACSGDVKYGVPGDQPTTNLDFRHALTAIRFAVGQNLSWNKTIDKVEIRGAVMKSKYTLSKEFSGVGATWDHSADVRGTATLSGVSVSTSTNPNTTIMGNTGDNYTFYMVPQVLTGKGVSVYVHCTDGTEITSQLKGEWEAGTTRTYKLSQTNSSWQYTLTHTEPSRASEYNESTSQPYGITSYREDQNTHLKQAVPWKVVGYDANDDGVFSMTEKPAWLTSLNDEGDGGTAADQGTATLHMDVIDHVANRNKGLKEAQPLGMGTPYDLSTKGGTTARSTANSYLISAPGHYRIPLVYGNAIENGSDNQNSYISQAPVGPDERYILRNFKDHAGNNIDNPWIEKTNGGANAGIDGAEIVWADFANPVKFSSTPIIHEGGNAYLDFEVKASDLTSCNVVVAVKKGNTIVWSWHLWFAPKDALSTIPVTNHQNVVYHFTKENLGWVPTKFLETTYKKARSIKVKVEQSYGNNHSKQYTVFTITQNPHREIIGTSNLYQAARKDAFPGMASNAIKEGSITDLGGHIMSIPNGIQHPNIYYEWSNNFPNDYVCYNGWSANESGPTDGVGSDATVIKTVYDPSPAGFKVPASRAFTGFTDNGEDTGTLNVDGTDDYQAFTANFGHNFWTNSNKNATIYFPAAGYHYGNSNPTSAFGGWGDTAEYLTAHFNWGSQNFFLYFDSSNLIMLLDIGVGDYGSSIRPVTE